MKTFKINEKKIEVPTSITQISLDKLEACVKIYNTDLKKIDKYIKLLSVLLEITEDEVSDLDIDKFQELIGMVNTDTFWKKGNKLVTEIEIDGVKFKTKSDGKTYNFSVKEVLLIQELVGKEQGFLLEIIAIIFRNVDENGKIINDLSDKAIKDRKKYLKNINVDIIVPYILSLNNLNA
jgi:hypothetical protein